MKAKAKESAHIKKARKKVKERLESESKSITPKALREMSKSIQKWLVRHSQERIPLKTQSFSLFDENRHSKAPHSKHVLHLLEQLKQKPPEKTLEGRVTYLKE